MPRIFLGNPFAQILLGRHLFHNWRPYGWALRMRCSEVRLTSLRSKPDSANPNTHRNVNISWFIII